MENIESSSTRGKSDPAWNYFSSSEASDGNVQYNCMFCGRIFKGGGIFRMKEHLAGVKGNIAPCKKVPLDVRDMIEKYLQQQVKKKKENKEAHDISFGDDETPQALDKGKRKATIDIDSYFSPRTTPGSQPSLKSLMVDKDVVLRCKRAWARWFYHSCIPLNALNSPYFQEAIDATTAIGPGFKVPSYYELRVPLLQDLKKECQLIVDTYKSSWESTGCTIMADGWTDQRQRTLINFLVYCNMGTTFIKSVDASDMVKSGNALSELFSEIVEWVGPKNVVHFVTDNAANYVSAGHLLQSKYGHIYWSPCAAHCINLILKDIGGMDHISSLASRASKITIFVYNHVTFLSWLRKQEDWVEIVRPAATRFATTFITLKSIYQHKHQLQNLVTSKHFSSHKLSKSEKGKEVCAIILDNKFWDACLIIVKIVAPLIRLLRIVDSDEKPSLGYIYDGMYRARKTITDLFKGKERLYKPYIDIIDRRWDKHLTQRIHLVAYFLNPYCFYSGEVRTSNIMGGLFDVIECKGIFSTEEQSQAINEIKLYREGLESFARSSAKRELTMKKMQPDEWWRLFGDSAPTLRKLAIRLLSQTASASGCERNWSVFERIHTKKRNRLEHQRLNDLVYVTYNLRMKNRALNKKRTYDPIDIDCIEHTDFWIEEEEPSPDLDYNELERTIYEENAFVTTNELRTSTDVEEVDANTLDESVVYESLNSVGEFGAFDDDETQPPSEIQFFS